MPWKTRKRFFCAFTPFPRSTWIHPHVPSDSFDLVCKNIWSRAREAEEQAGTVQSSPERQQRKDSRAPDSRHKAEEQRKQTDELVLSAQQKEDKQQYHTDFILPCPYLSGRRHPHVAKPARVLSPVMEVEMKRNEKEAKGKRNLRQTEDKQRSVENSSKKIWVNQSNSRRDKQPSTAPEPRPLVQNAVCSATEAHTPGLQEKKDPPHPSKLPSDACESEDEQNTGSSSDSDPGDDDDLATLPGVRTCATDSSDDDNSDCEGEKNAIPRSSDESSSDSEQDFPCSSTEKDFPLLSTIEAGIPPCPTEPPASGKMHGQWEIPLSFHPHDIPTATLASGVTAHAQAPGQGKAEAPQANSETHAPPAAPTQQEAFDLLADFPALRPPKNPLALGAVLCGNPKTEDAGGKRGLARSPNHRQESGASHQRGMENVPHEVSSICAGDLKSVPDLQPFGSTSQHNSPTISSEEQKANNEPPPRVAGTDGMGVNARSWASAAKVGMKQAAAPQEKARPCTFQQIVTINRAKVGHSAARNVANKTTPSHRAASPLATATRPGPRPRNPNQTVRPGRPHTQQRFGARAPQTSCPPGLRCPRVPFQQVRGNPCKRGHV